MHNEIKPERMIRIFSESAAQAKSEAATGAQGAHLRWALAEAIVEALKEGYLIIDLDCFRNDPRYTGNEPRCEVLFRK